MEIFHEDILETFLFCFLSSLGVIQIMVGIRGWHGLSVYGGRVRRNRNHALGAALVIFAYAWYFSDPLHRNVRNIEAFMSLLCLVLGIIAAAVATAALASFCEALRRRLARHPGGDTAGSPSVLNRINLSGGRVLLSPQWGEQGVNLVVIAEPGRHCEDLLRRLHAALPSGRGMLALQPLPGQGREPPDLLQGGGPWVMDALARVEETQGVDLGGETFLGLGWSANGILRLRSELEKTYNPRAILAIAPVAPDCERGFAGDALRSNSPLDIGFRLAVEKPWREPPAARLLRLWWPVLLVWVLLATAVTAGFDVRWKFVSGPVAGAVLSLWATYFLWVRGRRSAADESWEARMVSRLCSLPSPPGQRPLTVVLTHGDTASLRSSAAGEGLVPGGARLELWEDVLRGKFLLDGGTIPRLIGLIWEEGTAHANGKH